MTIKEEAEVCLGEEDTLSCVKKIVTRHENDECSPKFVLLVQPDCEPCASAQKKFAKDIEAGLIKKVAFDSAEGVEIIKTNNITDIPSLLLLDCQNKSIV